MVNRVHLALVPEHEDLVLQVPWKVDVCFYWALRSRAAVGLGDAEGFAARCDAVVVVVVGADIGEGGYTPDALPGVSAGSSHEGEHCFMEGDLTRR